MLPGLYFRSKIKFLRLLVGQWTEIEHNPNKWLWNVDALSMAYYK